MSAAMTVRVVRAIVKHFPSGWRSTKMLLILGLVQAVAACGGGVAVEPQQPATAPQVVHFGQGPQGFREKLPEGSLPAERANPTLPMREKVLLTAPIESPSSFNANGWYWNPAEGGSGIFIEVQGSQAFMGFFVYDSEGEATWFVAQGTVTQTGTGYEIVGDLKSYWRGQPLASAEWRAPQGYDIAKVRVVLNGPTTIEGHSTLVRGTAFLPEGRQMPIERFVIQTGGRPENHGKPGIPETGWYWDPAAGGRGWAIESQGDNAFMVVYHYAESGAPRWNVVSGAWGSGQLEAPIRTYRGGQTIVGPYKAPIELPSSLLYRATSNGFCGMTATYPGLPPVMLKRFVFASIATNSECRSVYYPHLAAPEPGSIAAAPGASGMEGRWIAEALLLSDDADWVVRAGGQMQYLTNFRGGSGSASVQGRNWIFSGTENNQGVLSVATGTGTFTASGSVAGVISGQIQGFRQYSTYRRSNAMSVSMASLVGAWQGFGLSVKISPSGAIVGESPAQSLIGSCKLVGQLTHAPASQRNLFDIALTATPGQQANVVRCRLLVGSASNTTLTGSAQLIKAHTSPDPTFPLAYHLDWMTWSTNGVYWQQETLMRQ